MCVGVCVCVCVCVCGSCMRVLARARVWVCLEREGGGEREREREREREMNMTLIARKKELFGFFLASTFLRYGVTLYSSTCVQFLYPCAQSFFQVFNFM